MVPHQKVSRSSSARCPFFSLVPHIGPQGIQLGVCQVVVGQLDDAAVTNLRVVWTGWVPTEGTARHQTGLLHQHLPDSG